ncbi:hypothetical protein BH10ACT6_BH10ACT6_13760 [soil metagenome]
MIRQLAVAATAGAIVLGSVGLGAPAFAASADTAPQPTNHSSLAEIQAAGARQTSNRITALNSGITRVTSTATLTASDKSTILATLNGDLSGMKTLQAKIAADTTVSVALADYRSIYTGYRVYAVGLQQVYIAAAADGLTGTGIPKLQSAASKISALFAADPTKVTPSLQAQLADMQAKTADAATTTSGLAAAALAVTPAAYNANHAVLVDLRASARDALADSKAAAKDGQAILAALK